MSDDGSVQDTAALSTTTTYTSPFDALYLVNRPSTRRRGQKPAIDPTTIVACAGSYRVNPIVVNGRLGSETMGYVRVMRLHWRTIVFLLIPVFFLPIAVVQPTQVSKAAYGVVVMAIFWATEVLPIPITALLPVVIFPVLGVMGAKELSQNYLKDRNMLILASLMVAASVEKCDLHRRISLGVIKFVGARRPRIMLGFMLPTWLLSMWISNTATTAIMFPVAQSILDQFDTPRSSVREPDDDRTDAANENTNDDNNVELQSIVGHAYRSLLDEQSMGGSGWRCRNPSGREDVGEEAVEESVEEAAEAAETSLVENALEGSSLRRKKAAHKKRRQNELFRKGLCLSIAYACNIGGSATLIGTGTNMVFKDVSDEIFSSHGVDNPITFAAWFAFWLPASFIGLAFAWVWLQLQYSGIRSLLRRDEDETAESTAVVGRVIQAEYDKLGPFS
ncbi:Solute carrier family 13 member 5 [Lamellibrachia satsuma]|nr:Solute carrier family 13 member 5 [Lamellibrachia satsuma]